MASDAEGRDADRPSDVPTAGWWAIAKRVWKESGEDNLSIVAAGVAFYGMLALFPAIAAMVSLWGLFADPAVVQQQITSTLAMLPAEAAQILRDQVTSVAAGDNAALSVAAIGALLLTLYSAAKGVNAMINALNVVYDEEETRGFVRLTLTSLALTLLALAVAIVALGLIAVAPAIFGLVGLGDVAETAISIGRWPALGLCVAGYLAALYRYGPDRDRPRWRWITPGAGVATVSWLAASALFSYYVGQFGSYNETYGTLGAVIVLLTWLWLSAYVVLLGAELDAEMEHQTSRDTTTGPEEPMGKRGAVMADTTPP